MIKSYKGEFAATIHAERKVPKGFPADLAKAARRKLVMLNNAVALDDLKSPPGNRLEALQGDLKGRHSIRINDQWRIVSDGRKTAPKMLRSTTTTRNDSNRNRGMTMAKKLPPLHPGEILREEFMKPLKLTPYAIAAKIGVPRTRIERVAREETPVTADTALRLGKFFGTTPAFWMNIQAQFDLETAADEISSQIAKIKSYDAVATSG